MNTQHETAPKEVKVWDPLVRIFHWSLVAIFAFAYVSGEQESRLHELAGYAVLALVGIRILWGFVGTRHARFRDFVAGPGTVLGYARDLVTGRAQRYLGHNPLGGAMIIALLVSITATGVSGWLLQGAEQGEHAVASGAPAPSALLTALTPIAAAHADDHDEQDEDEGHEGGDDALEEIHEFFAHLTLLLILLHVAGVIVASVLHRENLVRAMFTGRKSV
jgi:cytochrome b